MRLATKLVFFTVVVGWLSPAHAEDRAAARRAYASGSQHYKLGEYKEALSDFKEAFRQYEEPSFLYNIAQCERQLDNREAAVREYRMYLAESPNSPKAEEVHALVARLEKEIAAERAKREAATPTPAPAPLVTPPLVTPPPAAPATPLVAATPGPVPTRKTPAYKKWWVWTLVGTAVAGGAAAGLAVGLTRVGAAPSVATSLGTTRPFN
jgi:tetratricopeptide (TPR) repeat protein